MRTKEHQDIFDRQFLPIFAQVAPGRHYTWDMFGNLARPADTQDRRIGKTPYWELKSKTGQSCFDLWNEACGNSGEKRKELFVKLAEKLDDWYLNKSANGYTENANSKGKGVRKAKRNIAADIDKLNEFCPNFAPWTEKAANLLFNASENDNAVVAGIKEAFVSFYKSQDWESLREWDAERKWFYKNKSQIDAFVKSEEDPKYAMLRLMKFSNVYGPDYRQKFDSVVLNP